MSRGSSSIKRTISSSGSSATFTPSFLALGLRDANMSEMGLSPANSRSSASVKRSLKKSLSSISAPLCERNSLALRQLVQRGHV